MNSPSSTTSRPPRDVPLVTALVVLLRNPIGWFAWIFGGFGMIFVLGFLGNADLTSWLYFRGPLETARGTVTAVDKTSSSESGSGASGPIYRYTYQFTAAGTEYSGTSFRTGIGAQLHDPVTIEFPAGRAACSRIEGMRRAPFGPWVLFVLIFPAAGFGLVAVGLFLGWRNLKLITQGEMAVGKFTHKEWTSMRVNHRRVYRMWYQFTDTRGVMQSAATRTSMPEKFEAEPTQILFYDPAKPAKCLLAASLPRRAVPDERGQIQACSGWTLLVALLPILIAAGFTVAGFVLARAID